MKKYSKGEITKIILKCLLAGGAVVTVAALPGMALVFNQFQPRSASERQRVTRTVDRLKRQGLSQNVCKARREEVRAYAKRKK